jgi:hypothetical protein
MMGGRHYDQPATAGRAEGVKTMADEPGPMGPMNNLIVELPGEDMDAAGSVAPLADFVER